MNKIYEEYVQLMQQIADVRYANAVLQWDQETYLPPKGAAIRGRQLATLSEIAHKMFTDGKLESLLNQLKTAELSVEDRRNVDLTSVDYDRQKKLPTEFVGRLSNAVNRSFHKWLEARKADSFAVFSDSLQELIGLKRMEADYIGFEEHPYNALLQEFDKGSTVAQLDAVFRQMKGPLKDLLDKIRNRPQVDDSILKQHFPKEAQWNFGLRLLKDFGFDFEAGRQDLSEHPFTINFSSQDVRLTTRVDERDLSNMTWSCIHELGHGLYEQGLPVDQYGLPLGEPASLTIHESQSRLWENHIGRSIEFCQTYLPVLREFFPEQMRSVEADQLYRAINKVEPSFIRTEADELTYHFHVMIRFELEKLLLENQLQAADIPAFWNEQYARYLGVNVPGDRIGCLQDVHWSHGSFGYFPTYSMGSFYAAQFYRAAQKATGPQQLPLDSKPVLQWLRTNIHSTGRMYSSDDLCRKVTGESLQVGYFLDYLVDKYRNIYNF